MKAMIVVCPFSLTVVRRKTYYYHFLHRTLQRTLQMAVKKNRGDVVFIVVIWLVVVALVYVVVEKIKFFIH